MKEIEVFANALIHIGMSISIFFHIDGKKYSTKWTKLLFVIPMFSMFIGFYYLRCWIDSDYIEKYWRNFRIFEIVANLLFWILMIFKNYNLKKQKNDKK